MPRRGLLSIVSSLYDPLGIVAPVALVPKLTIQDLCRQRCDWDDKIPQEHEDQFSAWRTELPSIEQLSVDRCYKPQGLDNEFVCELHYFSDASIKAYGAACYLRVYDTNGRCKCSLVIGKSRLAPLKTITIPRLELAAAVVSVRLHQLVKRELDYTIHQVFFGQTLPQCYGTFEIQRLVSRDTWRIVLLSFMTLLWLINGSLFRQT